MATLSFEGVFESHQAVQPRFHIHLQALFTLYGFTFPITVALLQMAVIAPVCYLVARPKLEWGLARGIIPLALVNVLNVVCGLIGKQTSSSTLRHGLCMQCETRHKHHVGWQIQVMCLLLLM